MIRIGTAGWAMPRDVAESAPTAVSALHRYAGVLNAVEINSTFHRPHRPATFERWAASVDEDFRFAVKLPKIITHEAKLVDVEDFVDAFLEQTSALGDKRGPILIQTPPRLAFEAEAVARLASLLRAGDARPLAWEPRHLSWFAPGADAFLVEQRIARVAADPARHPHAAEPGGWRGLTYVRLHGSPRMYYSGYDRPTLEALAIRLRTDPAPEVWCMFDNTASGEAARNALVLNSVLEAGEPS